MCEIDVFGTLLVRFVFKLLESWSPIRKPCVVPTDTFVRSARYSTVIDIELPQEAVFGAMRVKVLKDRPRRSGGDRASVRSVGPERTELVRFRQRRRSVWKAPMTVVDCFLLADRRAGGE